MTIDHWTMGWCMTMSWANNPTQLAHQLIDGAAVRRPFAIQLRGVSDERKGIVAAIAE